jgi:putative ABC transport system substrate-binding protein
LLRGHVLHAVLRFGGADRTAQRLGEPHPVDPLTPLSWHDVVTVIAWPVAARAQQGERMRRIGWLTSLPSDAEEMARLAAFREELQKLGWAEGRNIQIDVREAAGDIERIRKYAGERVVLAPDVILANGISTAGALRQATRTVPIVFVQVTDAVGGGLVESLARPGGNATGFTLFEYSTSAKWLELLKQIAPSINRTAVFGIP